MSAVTATMDETGAAENDRVERALVDASVRGPVLYLYFSALSWLIVATILGFLSSMQLHDPTFFEGLSWLSYGRTFPTYNNVLAYGWVVLAGMGTAIWMVARLCRVAIRSAATLVCGTALWNLGVLVGAVGILAGKSTGIEWLEFPAAASVMLFAGFLLMGGWILAMFAKRRPGPLYLSMWYLVGAVLWFGWAYGSANWMLRFGGLQGAVQALVGAWYGQMFQWMIVPAFGLAIIYYFVPKVSGQRVFSYHLASLGFWSFAAIAVWTGSRKLAGGAVPAWVPTVGISAMILMLIPAATVAANFAFTLKGRFGLVNSSPTLRFVMVGAVGYTLAAWVGAAISLRSVASLTQMSHAWTGETHLLLYAFASMALFGSMYYIVPRLTGCEWFSSNLIRVHFWGAAYGIGMVAVLMLIGGAVQGGAWFAESPNPILAWEKTQPFLIGRSIGWVLLLFAHITFAMHFGLMLIRLGRPAGDPTLFHHAEVRP
jgi:cytochrome c oxidase cbb3-type subunit 1